MDTGQKFRLWRLKHQHYSRWGTHYRKLAAGHNYWMLAAVTAGNRPGWISGSYRFSVYGVAFNECRIPPPNGGDQICYLIFKGGKHYLVSAGSNFHHPLFAFLYDDIWMAKYDQGLRRRWSINSTSTYQVELRISNMYLTMAPLTGPGFYALRRGRFTFLLNSRISKVKLVTEEGASFSPGGVALFCHYLPTSNAWASTICTILNTTYRETVLFWRQTRYLL